MFEPAHLFVTFTSQKRMGNNTSTTKEVNPNTVESTSNHNYQPELRELIQQLGQLKVKDVMEQYTKDHLGQDWHERDFDMIAKTCKGKCSTRVMLTGQSKTLCSWLWVISCLLQLERAFVCEQK